MFAGGKKIEEKYEKLEKIGTGAYGVVYKAKIIETGTFVAIKKTKLDLINEGIPTTTLREVALLRELSHPNIVKLTDVQITSNRLHLVFEYMDSDLRTYLDSLDTNSYLNNTTIKSIMLGILKGMLVCHSRKIIHRDMKPQNILLDTSNTPKICDFGLARTFQFDRNQFTHQVVTLWYRAPELLLGQREYTTSIDMWSIGCIFAELITKRPLFAGDSELDQSFKIFKLLGTPNDQTWPGVEKLPNYKTTCPQWPATNLDKLFSDYTVNKNGIDLLKQMIEMNPSRRISVADALNHAYFSE